MKATATTPLTCKHFPAGEHGFFRAPVLITGARDALLIDGGFTFPDGKALAEAIAQSGKRLTTIYVTQSDPDYYFGLRPIRAAFPEARVIAASATIAAINGNVEKKTFDVGTAAQGQRTSIAFGPRDAGAV